MILEEAILGYEPGTELKDVTLKEALSWECNRCGGCCAGDLSDDVVKKDQTTGLPLFVWTSEESLPVPPSEGMVRVYEEPEDFYESRFGKRMLIPLVIGDGGVVQGEAWERDADDKPYKAFRCAFLREDEVCTTCTLREEFPNPDPEKPEQNRPLHCGEFPIFSPLVKAVVEQRGSFIPATSPFPHCTWYGIRIVKENQDG